VPFFWGVIFMSFISFLSVILDHKSVDLIKIIEFQNKEIEVLKAMNKEGRSYANVTEKRLLGTLAHEIRHILKLGKIETIFKPETILKWYRQFAGAKFDGSKNRKKKGRPGTDEDTIKLIIQIATEKTKSGWRSFAGLTSPFNRKHNGRVQGCTKQQNLGC